MIGKKKDFVRTVLVRLMDNGVFSTPAIPMSAAKKYFEGLRGAARNAMPQDFDVDSILSERYKNGFQCLVISASDINSGSDKGKALLDRYMNEKGMSGRQSSFRALLSDPSDTALETRVRMHADMIGSVLHQRAVLNGLEEMKNKSGSNVSYYHSWYKDIRELLGRCNARLYSDSSLASEQMSNILMTGIKSARTAMGEIDKHGNDIFTKGGTCGVVLGATSNDTFSGEPSVSLSVYHIDAAGKQTERANFFRVHDSGTMSICSFEARGQEGFSPNEIEEDFIAVRPIGTVLSVQDIFPSSMHGILVPSPEKAQESEAMTGTPEKNGQTHLDEPVSNNRGTEIVYDGI